MIRKKQILTFIIIVFGFSIVVPDTFAAGDTNIIEDMYTVLGIVLNIIYIITLPLLTIAGKAMDNSMVYGEFLNLDKPLYMLRNISRTFANFAIGGVFLYNILKYIFTQWGDDIAEVKKIIINSFIGAMAINFSRFVLGVLFDLSTILIYSLGSMPLSILNQTTTSNMPILSVNTFLDYSSNNTKTSLYYQRQGTNGTINISQCGQNGNIYKGMITGPEHYPTLPNKPEISFVVEKDMRLFCAVQNDLVDITKLVERREKNLSMYTNTTLNTTGVDYQYHKMTKEIVDQIVDYSGDCRNNISVNGFNSTQTSILLTQEQVESFGKAIPTFGKKEFCEGKVVFSNDILSTQGKRKEGFIVPSNNNEYAGYTNQDGFSMKTLLNQSKGMVGPFVTLYISLLDFSNLSINNSSNENSSQNTGAMIEFFVRTIIGVLLLIPLVALAVTMIIRVVILRGVIAFIPLGIVLKLLFDGKGTSGQTIFGAEISATNIIGLIFSPVLPVFALSISIIFIQALQGQMGQDINTTHDKWGLLGIEFVRDAGETNLTCADFWGLQELCYKTDDTTNSGSIFVNLFPWLFVNIFAIALMRFLVKAAMAASPMTKKAADSIMGAGQSLLANIPLIPTGDGKKIGLGAASTIPERFNTIASNVIENLDRDGEHKLNETIEGMRDPTKKKAKEGNIEFHSSTKTTTKDNVKKAITDTSPRLTNQGFVGALGTGAQTSADKEIHKQISTQTGGQQTNDIVAAIENIYKDDKEKDIYANHVITDRLKEFITGDITTSTGSLPLQTGKETELETFINMAKVKPYITSDEALLGKLKKLVYKKDGKEFKLSEDLKREESTSSS